jgi:hypothetical protein
MMAGKVHPAEDREPLMAVRRKNLFENRYPVEGQLDNLGANAAKSKFKIQTRKKPRP